MTVQISMNGEVGIVRISGKLDTQSFPEAQSHLTRLVEEGTQKILIDLEGLVYISSAGLRVLLSTAKLLEKDGGELRICSLNDFVREVFEISGFSTIFQVFAGESEAMDGF